MVNLPEAEKARWLLIAHYALASYAVPAASVQWLAYTHNAVFTVQSREKTYVLRIHQPDSITRPQLAGELHWLQHLHHENLAVPVPIATQSGDIAGQVTHNDQHYLTVLFKHLEGSSPTPETLSPEQMQTIGAFIAHIHLAAAHYQPPENIQRHRLDYEGLFGEKGIYHPGEALSMFTAQQRDVMNASTAAVKTIMDKIGQENTVFGMIHGDLLLKNILLDKNRVRALDFEYCGWGYFLYDLTPLLWQMKTHADRYNALEAALWQGYTTIHPLNDAQHEHLETFIVARQVASLRWLAQNLHNPAVKDIAPQLIQQRVSELEDFLDTGTLTRKSITL